MNKILVNKSVCLLILFLLIGPKWSVGQELVKEEVSFSIPKTLYFTGEKIWIDASVLQNGKASSSQVVYAELLDRQNQSVYLEKFLLEEGSVFHFLKIPGELVSDHYLLRVYTRISPLLAVENGLKQQFVTVFNPQKPPKVSLDSQARFLEGKTGSSEIRLSKHRLSPGETLTVNLSSAAEIKEVRVALRNPYLEFDSQIPSSKIYDSEVKGELVPELFGHVVHAQVDPRQVDTTKVYFLSVHGVESALYTDRPDRDGALYFDIGGLKHWNFVIAQADQNESLLDFELQSPVVKTQFKSDFQFPELVITADEEAFLQQLLLSSGIQSFYSEKYAQEPVPVVTGFVADRTFMLDDYTRFESVETVIKEYVPMVSVRTRQGKKEFRSINEFGAVFEKNPLMLVDGMPVFDSDQLAAFNPQRFERLDVLARKFFLNEQEYEGVLSFSSYKSDVGGFPLPSNAIFSQYKGIQLPVELERSIAEMPDSSFSDFRSILYWSADPLSQLPSGQTLEIQTSQVWGAFEVVVLTLSKEGEVHEERKYFTVENNP